MYVHVVEARSQPCMVFLLCCPSYFTKIGSLIGLEILPLRLIWLASKPQEHTCLCPRPRAGIISRVLGMKLGFSRCVRSILPADLSPRPIPIFLKWIFRLIFQDCVPHLLKTHHVIMINPYVINFKKLLWTDCYSSEVFSNTGRCYQDSQFIEITLDEKQNILEIHKYIPL